MYLCSYCASFFQDKSADYSFNNGVGVKNNIFACLVLGIYEVYSHLHRLE